MRCDSDPGQCADAVRRPHTHTIAILCGDPRADRLGLAWVKVVYPRADAGRAPRGRPACESVLRVRIRCPSTRLHLPF